MIVGVILCVRNGRRSCRHSSSGDTLQGLPAVHRIVLGFSHGSPLGGVTTIEGRFTVRRLPQPRPSRRFTTCERCLARPLLVGAVHGLAGSGALTRLLLATWPSTASRVAYIALFGLSMAAMCH